MPSLSVSLLGAAFLLGTTLAAAAQESGETPSVDERLEKLEERLEEQLRTNRELREEIDTLERRQFDADQQSEMVPPAPRGDTGLPSEAAELERRLGDKGGLYGKSFLQRAAANTYLGGYIDLEYRDEQNADRRFVQHRFIPFIYSKVTDQLNVAAEIEFEYGGTDAPGGDGETKVEFAVIDYHFAEELSFRAGAILVPLGKFNLIHDSPVNDLTDRPLVDQFVIPTTLTEAGLGFFGTIQPGADSDAEWKLDYEAYLVNGFRGLVADATSPTGFDSNFNESNGIRGGRASLRQDNNDSVAGVGRVAFSPVLGAEVGLSSYIGKYDDEADNWMWIYAVDFILQPGRFVDGLGAFEVLGELARAEISRDSLARLSGVPDDLWGMYGQLNYHFMFDALRDALPSVFLAESTFTAVGRMDHVELGSSRRERLTLGLNFRPTEDTVFKFDYQFNFEDWARRAIHNDAFVFSVATYF